MTSVYQEQPVLTTRYETTVAEHIHQGIARLLPQLDNWGFHTPESQAAILDDALKLVIVSEQSAIMFGSTIAKLVDALNQRDINIDTLKSHYVPDRHPSLNPNYRVTLTGELPEVAAHARENAFVTLSTSLADYRNNGFPTIDDLAVGLTYAHSYKLTQELQYAQAHS